METSIRYSKDHYWIKMQNENGLRIGITSFAQSELGEIVYLDLPIVGSRVKAGDVVGAIESLKSASEMYAPVSGAITEVNQALSTQEGLILLNSDPELKGWIFTMDMVSKNEYFSLLSAEDYKRFTAIE